MDVKCLLPGFLFLALGGTLVLPVDSLANEARSTPVTDDMQSAGFLNKHPDILYRHLGLDLLHRGQEARGLRALERAAFYSDKASQAVIADAYWRGAFGRQRDRPLAYAWIDLAAERGYPELLELREAYWSQLSAEERESALAEGAGVYARYGDEVAQARLARVLRRAMRDVTGSRTGSGIGLTIVAPAPGSGSGAPTASDDTTLVPIATIPGSTFYAPRLWRPEQYFKQQDLQWKEALGPQLRAMVSVGDVKQVPPATQPPPAGKRP